MKNRIRSRCFSRGFIAGFGPADRKAESARARGVFGWIADALRRLSGKGRLTAIEAACVGDGAPATRPHYRKIAYDEAAREGFVAGAREAVSRVGTAVARSGSPR